MAYHRVQEYVRDASDDCFTQNDSREVTFKPRVVNIVERRTTISRPEVDYSQDCYSQDWYSDKYSDEDMGFLNFQKNLSSPPQKGNAYYGGATREDDIPQSRRQVEIRSRGRASPYRGQKNRGRSCPPARPHQGRGSRKLPPLFPYTDRCQDKDGHKRRASRRPLLERSPARRDPHAGPPAPHAGSEGRGRSSSPDRENYTYQQLQQRRKEKHSPHWTSERSRASSVHASSRPIECDRTSRSSGVTQESCPASVAASLEVRPPSASPEPSPTPAEQSLRTKAITGKALEIEEHYAKACQTFGTVVNLLVEKKPSLEELLRAPLRANLLELKQRCLDDLKHFITELDQLNASKAST